MSLRRIATGVVCIALGASLSACGSKSPPSPTLKQPLFSNPYLTKASDPRHVSGARHPAREGVRRQHPDLVRRDLGNGARSARRGPDRLSAPTARQDLPVGRCGLADHRRERGDLDRPGPFPSGSCDGPRGNRGPDDGLRLHRSVTSLPERCRHRRVGRLERQAVGAEGRRHRRRPVLRRADRAWLAGSAPGTDAGRSTRRFPPLRLRRTSVPSSRTSVSTFRERSSAR